jgi:hypothetical protein
MTTYDHTLKVRIPQPMIQKYRKKPVEIEAIQLQPDHVTIVECIEFVFNIGMDSSMIGEAATVRKVQEEEGFLIPTLEGDIKATFGDYIIKGVKGEFYPCKPDIFYATYDGPTRVLWNHTTGEYDKEYLKQQESIDAGQFLADLLTKELDALSDEDLEPREEVQNLGVDPVLRLKEDYDPNTINFRWNDTEEVILKISKEGFYYRGELVEDIHNVYDRFNEWLTKIE